jgi:hypothetical protein
MPCASLLAHAIAMIACGHEVLYQQELRRFQGDWSVVEASVDGNKSFEFGSGLLFDSVGAHFRIKGDKLLPLPSGKRLDEQPVFNLQLDPFRPGRLTLFFWFIGIYEFSDKDTIRLCLKYGGQGVEGLEAAYWKPPSDFVVRKGQHHMLIVLKRLQP